MYPTSDSALSTKPTDDGTAWFGYLLATPDAIVISDTRGRIALVNPQVCEIFGFQEDELIGFQIEKLIPGRFCHAHRQRRHEYLSEPLLRPMGKGREVRGKHADGREIPLDVRLRMVDGPQGMLVIAAVRDLSQLRRLEAINQDRNRILEMIAGGRSLPDVLGELIAVIETQIHGGRCSILQWDRDDRRLRTLLAPRLERSYGDAIEKLAIGPDVGCCGAAATTGQRVIASDVMSHRNWVKLRKFACRHDIRACWAEPILDSRSEVLGTFTIYHGRPHHPDPVEIELVGTAARLAGIAIERDRRQKELLEKEEQLRCSQKLEAMGTLTGGIAHEFNNLLQVILGYTACALQEVEQRDSLHSDLKTVQAAAEQARSLTRQILSFGRRQSLQRSSVDANQIVGHVTCLIRPLIDARIQIEIDCADKLPLILADAGQLQQVLVNLSLNARDAIDGAGVIHFATSCVNRDGRGADSQDAECGQYVRIIVSDDGRGMTAEVRQRLFDPFFTTKSLGTGTGLGLSVAYGIVRDHGGTIHVASTPGEGTSFELVFPSEQPGTPADPKIESAGGIDWT